MKSHATKKPLPIEFYLQRIRDFYKKNGRAPKCEECERGQFTYERLTREYGSWENAVKAAIGIQTKYTYRTDESFVELIKRKAFEIGGLPLGKSFTQAERGAIVKRFGNVNAGSEFVLGNSVRLEILRIIKTANDTANPPITQEILAAAQKAGVQITMYELRGLLDLCARGRLLINGRYDRTVWWKLTFDGKELINKYSGRKHGHQSR